MPKGIAAIILAKKKPEKDGESPDAMTDKVLAGDLISAVKKGDKQAVVSAIKGLFDSYQANVG